MKRAALVLALLALAAAVWLGFQLRDRPDAASYGAPRLAPAGAGDGGVRATFLGVSTVLVEDGETALLSDGFFSRPGLLRVLFTRIGPDAPRIGRALERAGVRSLAAVLVVHSHYDHAMDAPEVARRTGAVVVGTPSTANVARGAGLAEDRIRIVAGGETLDFGRFRVTAIPGRHFPHGQAMGEIREPLVPPARATEYLEGGSLSYLIEHGARSLLIHGSAGYQEGALRGRHADVVFLGVGLLATRDEAYRDAYWREVVAAVGARRVVPIHWDDFDRSLDEPLVALPRAIDDFDATMRFLQERGRAEGVDVEVLPAFVKVDPFAGLEPSGASP
jgi:L-ascorbate metabolism protein UlaG (beta-lactamase superfamily)